MGKINIGRVIIGGFITAVVIGPSEAIRIPWFFNQYREVLANQDLILPRPETSTLVISGVLGVLYALTMILLYASIRPRFGAGPKTAVFAGLFVWFFSVLVQVPAFSIATRPPIGTTPIGLAVANNLWILITICVAVVAGAAVYKEED